MEIVHKEATVNAAGSDDDFPGSFEVILSSPTLDRDGDTLLPEDWKTPLPERINFDSDHGMSVATTVGSGVPSIDPMTGNLLVRGTFSSLPRAQEVRTLVKEGHVDRTSVTFMSEPSTTKDGKTRRVRELLSGAFVALPANREAVVLAAKSFAAGLAEAQEALGLSAPIVIAKAGARNAKSDMAHIQAIHDHALALGATPENPQEMPAKAPDAEEIQTASADVDAPQLPEPVVKAPDLSDSTEEVKATRTAELAPTAKALGTTEADTLAEDGPAMQVRAALYRAYINSVAPERG